MVSKIPLHMEHELPSNREKLPFLTFVLCFRTKLRSASFKNQLCVHPPLSALWCNLESSCSLAAFSEANHTSPLCQVIKTDISDASCLNTAVLKYSALLLCNFCFLVLCSSLTVSKEPQGSTLGFILLIYLFPHDITIQKYNISSHCYADDGKALNNNLTSSHMLPALISASLSPNLWPTDTVPLLSFMP